jgi:hypothetical protein
LLPERLSTELGRQLLNAFLKATIVRAVARAANPRIRYTGSHVAGTKRKKVNPNSGLPEFGKYGGNQEGGPDREMNQEVENFVEEARLKWPWASCVPGM